ncbi:MAG TPA: protein kinase [Polyangiaceae bacterium]|nr:protein kinase [Polyangiaceae bacterium]
MDVYEDRDPRIGTVLSERYRLDALLGVGGMGKVYAAEHVLMRKRLAVKVLHRELTLVPEVVARFEREAMAAANIEHPNVAGATDFGRLPDGSVFLVLEYVQGRSLREELARGRMPVVRALHIARQIAAALRAAHGHGIVHRDLKPENVMLVERDGDPDFVKVLDFGVAKVPIGEIPAPGSSPISRAGMVFGTPEYMAPEQALGEAVDGRADLYALGAMLFEMLAGVRPFVSNTPVGILGQQLSQPPPRFAERIPPGIVPPSVEQLVHRLLARDRDQRFATARAVEEALTALLAPGHGSTRFTRAVGSPEDAVRTSALTIPRLDPNGLPTNGLGPMGFVPKAFGAFTARIEALRVRLPPRVRALLNPVSSRTLALTAVLAASGLVVVGAALGASRLRSARASERDGHPARASTVAPPQAAPSRAVAPPVAPLPAVTSSGTAPSVQPAGEAETLITSALSAARSGDFAAAVPLVRRALELDPEAKNDLRLAHVLFDAAQKAAATNAAFALLDGAMGERGAEVIWDLAAEPMVPEAVRFRAGRWLRTKKFREQASPALKLAADLRTAKSCEQARGLLARAKDDGDERSLAQLEAWQVRTGCGPKKQDDCMPCLRTDQLLEEAIAAIRARGAAPWKQR